MKTFNVRRMSPSARRHLEDLMPGNDTLIGEYFDRVVRMLLQEYSEVDLIDEIWISGMENRRLYGLLSRDQQIAIKNIDTDAARCFLNAIHGRDWDHGLDDK